MHPRTEATLKQLEQAEWFRCVGIRDTEVAEVLSSWSEAISSYSSHEWEHLSLVAANTYRQRLAEKSPERFGKWNEIVRSIKPAAHALVTEKTRQVIKENDLPKSFVDTVNWDIIHLCMEAECADIYPAGYYAKLAYWYLKGHFPCGWQGEFPQGKLLIY